MRSRNDWRCLALLKRERAQALGFRLGYQNPIKGAGRVRALCDGHLTNRKSKVALARLPEALGLPSEIVERALIEAKEQIAEGERRAEDDRRLAREKRGRRMATQLQTAWGHPHRANHS